MFTIENIKRSIRPFYVFENGEFYAMFKTKREAERAIAHAIENRAETEKVEAAARAERLAKVAAYIESRKSRIDAQMGFGF